MFKSLFDPESPFGRGMEKVWQLIVLNVLWLLCSLPVVTLGASTAALQTVLLALLRGEDHRIARRFFAAFRENWKRASAVWLVLLVAIALCLFDWKFAVLMDSFLWKLIAVAGLTVVALICSFVFTLIARYENTGRNHLRNALLLGVGNLPRLLLVWMVWAGPVVLTVWSAETLHFMILLWLMAGVSGLSLAGLRILKPVYDRLDEGNREE